MFPSKRGIEFGFVLGNAKEFSRARRIGAQSQSGTQLENMGQRAPFANDSLRLNGLNRILRTDDAFSGFPAAFPLLSRPHGFASHAEGHA